MLISEKVVGLLQKHAPGAAVEVKRHYYSAVCITTNTALITIEMEVSDAQVIIDTLNLEFLQHNYMPICNIYREL